MGKVELAPKHDPRVQALEQSPVLANFLVDFSDFEKWQTSVFKVAEPLLDNIDEKLGDNYGMYITDTVLGYARTTGVFPEEKSEEGIENMQRLITLEIMFIGWQLNGEEDLLSSVTLDITKRVKRVPYVSSKAAKSKKKDKRVEHYVRASLAAGLIIKSEYDAKIQKEKIAEENKAKEEAEQISDYPLASSVIEAFKEDVGEWKDFDDNNQEMIPV